MILPVYGYNGLASIQVLMMVFCKGKTKFQE
jgi:hypothetical protein